MALILVLWLLVLLSVIVLSFSGTARTQAVIARNLLDNTQARWLADAGVRFAARRLWLADADPAAENMAETWRCRFGPGRLSISIQNVAGLIDLNAAPPDTLSRLFATAGLEAADAARLATIVADFRDSNDRRRTDGAEAEDYAAAGLPHGPKNGEFRAVEELEQVLDMPSGLIERVRTAVTVHSGQPVPDLGLAPPLVRLTFGQDPERPPAEGSPLPKRGDAVFRITVTARTDSGARFTRVAVLAVRGTPWTGYRVLQWGRAPENGRSLSNGERRSC
ncbi:MAG: general secretion pathway protein GspK [Alphaproteobacteria bacterium]